jgi:hypothetical protein
MPSRAFHHRSTGCSCVTPNDGVHRCSRLSKVIAAYLNRAPTASTGRIARRGEDAESGHGLSAHTEVGGLQPAHCGPRFKCQQHQRWVLRRHVRVIGRQLLIRSRLLSLRRDTDRP